MSDRKIKPALPAGVRDYLPGEMIVRNEIFQKITDVCERFGFDPLDTPGLERTEVLTGGQKDFPMIIYNARLSRRMDDEEADTSLRFDLTVPLSRVMAAYPELVKPFKRYQIGKVWRGEKPQLGRFREFIQFDADIVGSASMKADTEIINLMYEIMKVLGFDNFIIRFNDRKVLNSLADYAGFEKNKINGVLRALDKLEKIGREGVIQELTRKPDNAFDEGALNLSDEAVTRIMAFLDLNGTSDELLRQLPVLLKNSYVGQEGIKELGEIVGNLRALGLPEKNWQLDVSIARGLEYYTGPVFELNLTDLPQIGSVFSGGRYDGLLGRFSENCIPATGASVGVDRLFVAMEKMGRLKLQRTVAEVFVPIMDKNFEEEYIKIVTELRAAGFKTNLYLGGEIAFKAQLAYAVKMEIPVMIIVGENEIKNGTVQIKDMQRRTQEEVKRADYLSKIKTVLGK